MIYIDKTSTSTRLVLTLKEETAGDVTSYSLVMKSKYDGRDYEFELPANSSAYPDRYDEFIVSTSTFDELIPGQYSFTVQTDTGLTVELGRALVSDVTQAEEFIYLSSSTTDDDYIVYNG